MRGEKMAQPRDYQRQKVYNWESDFEIPDTILALPKAEQLVCTVWADYLGNKKPPRVTAGRKDCRPNGGRDKIALPSWCRTAEITLHETAHAIISAKPELKTEPWHGPVFVELYIQLLLRYLPGKYEESALRSLAANRKIIVAYAYKEVPKPRR